MVQPDYRGARGSNTGDDFHELWALRQSLALLDQDAVLTAVAVEGLRAEDESGTPLDTWDGVDCTLYYGGDDAVKAERIVIAQLKYSAANPEKAWTVARLTQTSNKKKDNAVVGRLAKAFTGLKNKRPDLVASGNVVVRLVSNQLIDPAVVNALSDESASGRAALLTASGLEDLDFETFAKALDLSECGYGSRFALEERVLSTISNWTDDDARTTVNDLLRLVHQAMLPEAKGEFITRQSILARLGFSDPGALFPCPSAIKRVDRLIPREASRIVADRMTSGDQRICLHGGGGSGKTTALQEITRLLPIESVVIVFDGYGNGRYLDSDAYRHRPSDAFLQVSNDLARQLRIPLLLSRKDNLDHPRVFKKRLERAAEVVASRHKDALLVVIVDAADNSVIAASSRAETSFVREFVRLGDLPTNVRLVVTARTGRLPILDLPGDFKTIEIKGFDRDETAAHVRGFWKDVPDFRIDDFHHLSGGNPRVQQYALDYAGREPARALDYLRPSGKNLDQIFRAQLEYARQKVGQDQDIKLFCAGLVALARPISLTDLAAVTELNTAHVRDLCADLAPGVRLTNESIGFADEDFEHFVRVEGETQLSTVQATIADYLLSRHTSDAYAATHVAAALLATGRGREIINLINTEREPKAITDPVLRREAQLERLRIAMKVCRESGNNVDSMLTLLIGAEALKTDAAIRRTIVENPDLAANFARDTSGRVILRDPDEIENHGALLFHLMAADARNGDGISVREGHRQIRAWLQRRNEYFEEQKKQYPKSEPRDWKIATRDIAADTEAVLRIAGPKQALENLLRWSPKSLGLHVASILSLKLITLGESSLVERCIAEAGIRAPWDLFLLTPLALAGKDVDLSRLEFSLGKLLRRGLIRLDRFAASWRDDEFITDYFDIILTACEMIVARGGNRTCVVPVLERFADRELRRRDQIYSSRVSIIDFSLRAQALLERLANRETTLQNYLVDPPEPPEDLPVNRQTALKRSENEKKEELTRFIGPLVEIYDLRAQALVGSISTDTIKNRLNETIARLNKREYQFSIHKDSTPMRIRVALSITRLMVLSSLDRAVVFECARSLLRPARLWFISAETQVFASLALERSLHQRILSAITIRADAIRRMRIAAREKLDDLIHLARLLLSISYEDARGLFNEAIDVAGELDVETIHAIALFAPLAERAVGKIPAVEKRIIARDLAIVIEDASVRLAGYDDPWEEAARALASLDVCLALAAVSRWEDSDVFNCNRNAILLFILDSGLTHRELTPVQVSALSPLVDGFSVAFMARIVNEAVMRKSECNLKTLADHLAWEEVLRFGQGKRKETSEKLSALPIADTQGFWLDQLIQVTKFHDTQKVTQQSPTNADNNAIYRGTSETERTDPCDGFQWSEYRFVSESEIEDVISRILKRAQNSETFLSDMTIFDKMRSSVNLGDRCAHLEALSRVHWSYALADAIAVTVASWRGTPAVDYWCRERLLQIVVDRLPAFSRGLARRSSILPNLLEKSGAQDHDICAALIEGMERHVDALDAETVYELVGLIGRYCTPTEATQVIKQYVNRLVQRIPASERDKWNLADIPTEASESVARFLYALMGDVDVRIRWRAAHALRCLVRLGDTGILDKLVGLYDRKIEKSYRAPDAPFYWLDARLWLVMSLDRIAEDRPSAIGHHGQRLLEIASDDDFPHVLVRSFAESAVEKLAQHGVFRMGAAQKKRLYLANKSPIRRKKALQPNHRVGFDRYNFKENETRRFHFDSMDTLPYWYSRPLRCFADLNSKDLLDVAERWIVDRWGVSNNPWEWDMEPRQQRLSDRSVSSWHSHGSLPTLERFHTYLEWHAMWCAVGELMQTRALAKAQADDYDTFERWLKGYALTVPPMWLADLCGPKPLETRLWFVPQGNIDAWVENVCENDFLSELGLVSRNGRIIVGGHHETRSGAFALSARVRSALVSPDTARALVRALQTVDDSWDYHIPLAGDDSEIDVSPYKLKGWIINDRQDLGIDERDPFRYEIRGLEYCPSSQTAKDLNLEFVRDGCPRWVDVRSRDTVFTYEAWSDNLGDEGEDRRRYDGTVRSAGARLLCDKKVLKAFMNKTGLVLIVEVEIIRKTTGYEYSRYDEEKAKESKFDRVVLLREDGTIEAAEGTSWDLGSTSCVN